jgi:hypothetical protein
MTKADAKTGSRRELLVPILIALVSLTTAVAAWRTSQVGSTADQKNMRGLVDAVKLEAFTNEDWGMAYEEAGYASTYLVQLAEVEALEASGEEAAAGIAATQREYLLPGLLSLGEAYVSNGGYVLADGSLDIQRRFADLSSQNADAAALDPEGTFDLAAKYHAEQRWLVVGTVLLAISLFWLGLAQISGARLRLLTAVLGAAVYLFGLAWFVGAEIVFVFIRTGAS